MKMMKCKICGRDSKKIFNTKILNKYNINYFYCKECGFIQTQEPYWLDKAYEESINITDTGIMQRNLYLSKITSILLFFVFDKNAKFLDYAGGYGIFTRLMRDIGFDFYWYDKYSENLLARGFEYKKTDKIELITSFEAFEHFVNPSEEIEKMLGISKNIFFSTELYEYNPPKPDEWWYYGLEHGQHISFYSIKTLNYIANKYKLNLYTNGRNLHLLTEKKINNVFFKILLKVHRFGLANIVSLMMKSKTIEDWELLKNLLMEKNENIL